MNQVEAALIWAAGICAAIATIWGLVNKITAALKKPVNDLAVELDTLSKRIDDLKNTARNNSQRLGAGDHSFEIQAQMNKHMLHSMSLLQNTVRMATIPASCRSRRKSSMISSHPRPENFNRTE